MNIKQDYGSLAIASYPLLTIYATGIPGISIGEFVFLILSVVYFIYNSTKLQLYFANFTIYTFFISLVMCMLHEEYLSGTFAFHAVSTFLIVYIISIACAIGNIDNVTRQIKKITLICIAFFGLQYVLFLVTSSTISGILPFLPLSNGENSAEFHDLQMGRDRMSSFFEEPAHFSEFLCIPLCIYLFETKSKKDFAISILITICIFLSTSALGAVSVVIIWGMRFLEYLRNEKQKWISYLVVIIMILSLPTLAATELVTSMTSRITEISGEGVENSAHGFSSYIRVMRGYIPYLEQTPIIQIVGNGIGSLESYIKTHNSAYLDLVDIIPDYINSIQYILLGSGIIGLFLFIKQIYKIYKNTTPIGKTLLLTMLAQMFASGIHSSPVFMIAIFIAIKNCTTICNKIE